MNELSGHIEALLLENDCVIIPGLGGFVAHTEPASWVATEGRWMPPTRVIGFNPQLKLNDGLLAQSFMSVYGNSFPDATRMVEKKVKNLRNELHDAGRVELPNIGELRMSLNETYEFHPYDHQITTPSLYGLEGFEMRELPAAPRQKPQAPSITTQATRHAVVVRQARQRRLRRALRQGALHTTTAVLMLLLVWVSFFISSPIENTEIYQASYARLSPAEWIAHFSQQSLAITSLSPAATAATAPQRPAAVVEADTTQSAASRAVERVSLPAVRKEPAKSQAAATTNLPWHIIVASVGTEKDARAMADQLVKQGHTGAKAVIGDGKMRVSIRSFATEAEAYKVLQGLREQEAYKGAWVLKKK